MNRMNNMPFSARRPYLNQGMGSGEVVHILRSLIVSLLVLFFTFLRYLYHYSFCSFLTRAYDGIVADGSIGSGSDIIIIIIIVISNCMLRECNTSTVLWHFPCCIICVCCESADET